MAILKGIECSIHIGSVKATEYGEEIDGDAVTVYIIAEEGKPFAFHCNFSKSSAGRHDFQIFTDGISQANHTSTVPTHILSHSIRCISGTTYEQREFVFGKLQTGRPIFRTSSSSALVDMAHSGSKCRRC